MICNLYFIGDSNSGVNFHRNDAEFGKLIKVEGRAVVTNWNTVSHDSPELA
jgi:hypothetical protein